MLEVQRVTVPTWAGKGQRVPDITPLSIRCVLSYGPSWQDKSTIENS